jgi:RNA polymerase sigma-70 factor, ECF subfamily
MDDAELLQRAADGDAVAFELLVRRHADGLWRLARSVLRDDHLAEEAVQDTFVKAHDVLGSFRGEAAVRTWLSTICYRACVDRLRRRQHNVVPLDAARHRARAEDHDLRLVLQEALAALPDAEQEAFALVHVLGYRREEAAAIVGVPASTLRSRVARAQLRLAATLADDPTAAGGQQP